VRGCLERLLPQARAGDVEIIVADGSDRGIDVTADGQVTWLRRPGDGPHELRHAALTESRGDVVAFTEDHCDVAPDWCRQIVCAHERHSDASAIAGVVTNGATKRAMDRASFLLVHGPNVTGRSRRPPNWFPPTGSNVSYKREKVLPLVRRPGDLELRVTPRLLAEGALRWEESVVLAHSQSMRATAHVRNHFHAARSHAGLVAEGQALARRWTLARDSVTLPRNLLSAALAVGREVPGYRSESRRLLPAMTVLAAAAGAGYLAGVTGPGGSLGRLH
jgi:hypothetical protein